MKQLLSVLIAAVFAAASVSAFAQDKKAEKSGSSMEKKSAAPKKSTTKKAAPKKSTTKKAPEKKADTK